MTLDSFTAFFAAPWALIGILAIPLYVFVRLRLLRRQALPLSTVQFAGPTAFRAAQLRLILLLVLESLLIAALFIGIAKPGRDSRLISISEEGIDVALVLDISASMMAADFTPTRLDALRQIAGDFVERSSGDRIAVILFAGEAFTQSPLTSDRRATRELIDGIAYEMINHATSGGTAIGDALLVAVSTLERQRVEGREQVIVLITDGANDRSINPLTVAPLLVRDGIGLFTIGVAGLEPIQVFVYGKPFIAVGNRHLFTSLNDESLREMTAAAGGRYYRAIDDDSLKRVFAEISSINRSPLETHEIRVRESYSYLWAFFALGLYLLRLIYLHTAIRRPIV